MIAILAFLWDLLIMGKLPWKKEEEPTYQCPHRWGHWFLKDFGYPQFNDLTYRARVEIARICNSCGKEETVTYNVGDFFTEVVAKQSLEMFLISLNEGILKPPAPPAPKPEPIKCDHEFNSYKIASRFLGAEQGEIVIERYCTKCMTVDKKSYFTEKYNEDAENSNLIYQDLLLLEQSLNATILKES